MALNPKQLAFVQAYLIEQNATKAAITAGYSAKTAHSQGPRLLDHVGIKKAIQKEFDKRAARVQVTADDVLQELKRLAFVDFSKAYDSKGRLLPIKKMPEDIRRAIAGIDVITNSLGTKTKKIKFYDKAKSLEMLGRHLKLFTDKREITGADGKPIQHEHKGPQVIIGLPAKNEPEKE
jgi:phage terminase small subunit